MKKEIKGFVVGSVATFILTATVGFATGTFKTVDVYENNVSIYANGNYVDAPNFTYNDTTYVPLRAVLEKMDCVVGYDDSSQAVRAYNNYMKMDEVSYYLNGSYKPYQGIMDTTTFHTYVDIDFIKDADFSISSTEHNGIKGFMCMDNDKYVAFDTNNLPSSSNSSTNSQGKYNSSYSSGSYSGNSSYYSSKITASSFPLYLYSDEDKPVFLGKLTSNQYDSDSVYNTYGSYGSQYSQTSIFNSYSSYGSAYSQYSAFNKYASKPPRILDADFNEVGRLTNNTYISNGYTWEQIDQLIK